MHVIAKHTRQSTLYLNVNYDMFRGSFRPHQGDNILHHVFHVQWLHLDVVSLEKLAHPANHFGGTAVVPADVADNCTQFFEIRFFPA